MEFKKIYIDLVNKHSGNANVFFPQLVLIANRLGIKPEWIADVIYIESGYNPKAYNKNGGASGLIQWVPTTALGYGITTEKIRSLSNLQQIPYIERYLKDQIKSAGMPKDWFETYLLVFHPYWVGKPETTPIKGNNMPKAGLSYTGNYYIDLNKDGFLTKGEFRKWANSKLPKSPLQDIVKK